MAASTTPRRMVRLRMGVPFRSGGVRKERRRRGARIPDGDMTPRSERSSRGNRPRPAVSLAARTSNHSERNVMDKLIRHEQWGFAALLVVMAAAAGAVVAFLAGQAEAA